MRIKNKKPLLLTTVCLAVIIAGGLSYYFYSTNNKTAEHQDTSSEKNAMISQSKNNETATANESSEPGKPQLKTNTTNSDPQAQTTINQNSGKTTVSVITSVDIAEDTVYIRGGINNIVSGGVCKLSLKSSSGTSLEKESPTLPNASTVDCKTIKIPVSELSSGTWTYVLKYSSDTAEGTSNENSFQIN